MKVFGYSNPDLERIPVPVGRICFYCGEEIAERDPGYSQIYMDEESACRVYLHRACFLRQIIGSVAHLEQTCSCYVPDSTEGDPPGMTKRQGAEAAARKWQLLRNLKKILEGEQR